MMVDDDGAQGVETPQFWFNVTTGQVEQGKRSSWEHVMGPYPTREQAQAALDTARERNQSWDEDDEAWREN